MKPTITNNNIKYGLFRADATIFSKSHCLQNEIYSEERLANAARLKMRKQVTFSEKNLIIVHQIEEEKRGSPYAVEE